MVTGRSYDIFRWLGYACPSYGWQHSLLWELEKCFELYDVPVEDGKTKDCNRDLITQAVGDDFSDSWQTTARIVNERSNTMQFTAFQEKTFRDDIIEKQCKRDDLGKVLEPEFRAVKDWANINCPEDEQSRAYPKKGQSTEVFRAFLAVNYPQKCDKLEIDPSSICPGG
eukprot:CAMPEP_0179224494 /NCGR_PEP_ID=MMETSP0797-20121207/7814_1 /TAXON_ID=47934 /ORGANISM="Dinophysis acuminata, Strain DAEP01" /LENGTH=168 /DNA_ID=CAMNT_0020931467 /DNA_START=95 /DNA_END=598 /DNA_ORIENTATION=-